MKKYVYGVLFTLFLAMAVAVPPVQAEKPPKIYDHVATRPDLPSWSAQAALIYNYTIVSAWPHDPEAFTQGLVFHDGFLFESTGLYGHSSLRKVELETGNVLQKIDLPEEYFAEGLAFWGGSLFQLTWQNNIGFVYDLSSFEKQREWTYAGEGWGLTTDGQFLIMSDGTSQIRFLDPTTLAIQRTINVVDGGRPVTLLNELEYVNGEIYANVFQTNVVVFIDPASGNVVGRINFGGLLQRQEHTRPGFVLRDVLNGIAYDAETDRLFVTGKQWPKLFEVRVVPNGSVSP